MITTYVICLQLPNTVLANKVSDDRAEPVDAGLRVPERRDGGRGGHPPLGPPARAAQPPGRAAAAAVPPRRRPHVGRRGDLALQSGTDLIVSEG